MGNLFGKKQPKHPALRVTEQDRAVLQLKQQRDKVKQFQKKVVLQLEKDREMARKLLQEGKKDKAKLMLRKKKFQETLLEKTDVQLDNLEQLVHDIEFAQIEMQVVKGLEIGNAALKKMHAILSLEDVERIMDETKEGIEMQQEIDSILAGGLTQDDENEVMDELEQILAQAESDKHVILPDVPTDEVGRLEKEKAKEKRKNTDGQRQAVPAS